MLSSSFLRGDDDCNEEEEHHIWDREWLFHGRGTTRWRESVCGCFILFYFLFCFGFLLLFCLLSQKCCRIRDVDERMPLGCLSNITLSKIEFEI